MGTFSNVRQSAGIALDALTSIKLQMLIYPVLATILGILIPVVFLWLGWLLGGGMFIMVAMAGMIVGYGIVFSSLMVAYCYELNEVFQGRSPTVGEGIGVALNRFKLVVIAGLVFGAGGFAVRFAGDSLPFGDLIGVGSSWGLSIAGVFAFPVVATTRGSIQDAFQQVLDAVEKEWGKSLAAVVSTRAIGVVITWTGIFAAVALLVLAILGDFAVDIGPLGLFTLPLVVAAGSVLLAVIVQFTIDGVVRTALFRYARDGQLPPALSSDPDALVETNQQERQVSGRSAVND